MAIYLVNPQGTAVAGVFAVGVVGWRFISWTQNGTSRKTHKTLEAATPRAYRDFVLVEAASPQHALRAQAAQHLENVRDLFILTGQGY